MESYKIVLLVLGIINWAFVTLYVFFRKNKTYDWIYIGLTVIMIIFGSGGEYIMNLLLSSILSILMVFNMYTMLTIYKISGLIKIPFTIAAIVYFGYYRLNDYISMKVKKIKEYPLPEWIKESTYLKRIYDKKINTPISYTDIVSLSFCIITNRCLTRPIDWTQFEEHCAILREKTNPDTYDYVVGIESGGAFIGRLMRKDCKYIKISKYDDNPNFLGKPHIKTRDDLSMLRGSTVLVVDDQILTGSTIKTAKQYLIEVCGARKVDTCVLYSRTTEEQAGVDYVGMPYVIVQSPWGFSA